jgi:hypothetical protein
MAKKLVDSALAVNQRARSVALQVCAPGGIILPQINQTF